MGELVGLKNSTKLDINQVLDLNSDSSNDVILKSSYGWLFPTVTAFCLLIFLFISFTCYHRRLATRKAREDEYAEFLRVYRPDLSSRGLTKPRTTLIAFSANALDNLKSTKDSRSYINEGFEFSVPDESLQTMEPNYSKKMETTIDSDLYSYLQHSNKNTNNNYNTHGKENNVANYYQANLASNINPIHDTTNATIHTNSVDDVPGMDLVTHMDKNRIEKYGKSEFEIVKNDNSVALPCNKNRTEIVQIKSEMTLSMASPPSSLQSTPQKQIDGGTHNSKMFKKRHPTLKQYGRKTSSLSFDDDTPYIRNHYNSPQRESQPSLYFDNAQDDLKQTKVEFNPYYVEIGSRLDSNALSYTCSQRSITHDVMNHTAFNHIEAPRDSHVVMNHIAYNHNEAPRDTGYSLHQSNKDTLGDVYYGNIVHSTWM